MHRIASDKICTLGGFSETTADRECPWDKKINSENKRIIVVLSLNQTLKFWMITFKQHVSLLTFNFDYLV